MLKRKYGSRYDWKRVTKRNYAEMKIGSILFNGYVTLLHLIEVNKPLTMTYEGRSTCIAADGYYWMQHFPVGEHYSVTTVFDASKKIVQWYIDICKENGYCNKNGPWMDDLYLDLIVLPTGEIIEKDIDELEVALKENIISGKEYEMARFEFTGAKLLLEENRFEMLNCTSQHFEMLINKLMKDEPSIKNESL